MTVKRMVEGIRKWFVICQHKELTAFEVVSKMTYREVYHEEFTTKHAVSGFCWLEAFGEETKLVAKRDGLFCWRTTPTATSEASVMRLISASGCGRKSKVDSARAVLMLEKADLAASVHLRALLQGF